jgi:hypothetical protein
MSEAKKAEKEVKLTSQELELVLAVIDGAIRGLRTGRHNWRTDAQIEAWETIRRKFNDRADRH